MKGVATIADLCARCQQYEEDCECMCDCDACDACREADTKTLRFRVVWFESGIVACRLPDVDLPVLAAPRANR